MGSTVVLPGGQKAILRYVGNVMGRPGVYAGLELLGDVQGKNSGDVDGVRYFNVSRPLSGIFYPYQKLQQYASPSKPTASPESAKSWTSSPYNQQELTQLRNEMDARDQEYNEMVTAYETKLAERNKILHELQVTVENFEPLMNESEKQMLAKEERFAKYKENTEKQMKELIDAIELLEKQSDNNKALYEKRLEEVRKDGLQNEALETEMKRVVEERDQAKQEAAAAKQEAAVVKQRATELEMTIAEQEKQLSQKNDILQRKNMEIREKGRLIQQKDEMVQTLQARVNQLEAEKAQKAQQMRQTQHTHQNDLPLSLTSDKENQRPVDKQEAPVLEEPRSEPPKLKSLLNPTGELLPYHPPKSDPTAGRAKWCGLCEREGHESFECPYESDLF